MLAIVSVAVTKKAATFDLTQHMPDCAPAQLCTLASLVRSCLFVRSLDAGSFALPSFRCSVQALQLRCLRVFIIFG